MEHIKIYVINVGFYIVYILSKWIQLQYGGKHYSNLKSFQVNQPNHILEDMLIKGTNYVQDFLELFSEVEQYHAREICLRE
jgi:hypothetical protein